MKAFRVDDTMLIEGYKTIRPTDALYESVVYPIQGGSYNVLPSRVCGMTYGNYLRMVRTEFGATLFGKSGGYIVPIWSADDSRINILLTLLNEKYNQWSMVKEE